MWHRRSKTLRKNVKKLIGSQYPFAQISFFTFFLTVLDRRCHKFSKGYSSNFSTELSSQIFDCCPRNFLIQEERIGNVVSTSHWIRPVFMFFLFHKWKFIYPFQNNIRYKDLNIFWKSSVNIDKLQILWRRKKISRRRRYNISQRSCPLGIIHVITKLRGRIWWI